MDGSKVDFQFPGTTLTNVRHARVAISRRWWNIQHANLCAGAIPNPHGVVIPTGNDRKRFGDDTDVTHRRGMGLEGAEYHHISRKYVKLRA